MKLNIETSMSHNGITILAASGSMNALTIASLKEELRRLVAEGKSRVVIDLAGVEFMDSSGLSSLISGLKATREKAGFLRLANVQAGVRHVFEITMLDRVFEMYPSVDAASGP